jgi:hypothetical protein
MSWARVDDGAYTHPKFLGLDPAAIGLWAMALSYCNHHLTDGFIARTQVPRLVAVPPMRAFKLAGELLKHGLWEERGKDGFQVHDYLDWNPSAAEVRKQRALHSARQARYIERARDRQPRRFGHTASDASPDASAGTTHDAAADASADTAHATPHHDHPPIVPPSPVVVSTPSGDPDATWSRTWMPPPGTIYPDGCARPEFEHLFPQHRRGQCPRHRAEAATS